MPLVALALKRRLCNASAPVNFFIVNLLGDLSSCTYSDHLQKCSACLRNIWHQILIFDTSAAVGPRPSLISVSKSNACRRSFWRLTFCAVIVSPLKSNRPAVSPFAKLRFSLAFGKMASSMFVAVRLQELVDLRVKEHLVQPKAVLV